MNHDTSNKVVNNIVYKYATIIKDSFKLVISACLAGVMLQQLPQEIIDACDNPFVHFFIFLNLIEHDKSMRIVRAFILNYLIIKNSTHHTYQRLSGGSGGSGGSSMISGSEDDSSLSLLTMGC